MHFLFVWGPHQQCSGFTPPGSVLRNSLLAEVGKGGILCGARDEYGMTTCKAYSAVPYHSSPQSALSLGSLLNPPRQEFVSLLLCKNSPVIISFSCGLVVSEREGGDCLIHLHFTSKHSQQRG